MNEYVTYNADYKVLICCQHKYAIVPDWVSRHFQEFHKATPLATRQLISDYSKTLELAMPDIVAAQQAPVYAIDGLAVVDGFQCQYTECCQLRSTERSIKEHCREEHEWKVQTGVMWKNQAFQTFFNGRHRKYVDPIAG
jgi:hypothetical protein